MGSLHWMIVIPYYFFGTLAALPLLMIICRLARLKVTINALVGSAIALSVAALIVPLACGWVRLATLTGRPLLVIGLLSFALAAIDAALVTRLPQQFDADLEQL